MKSPRPAQGRTSTTRIFAYRLLRVGRGDASLLPGFEENDYARAAASNERRVADLVEEWNAVRHSTFTLVAGMLAFAWATYVTLRPRVRLGAESTPTTAQRQAMHHEAHEECFIARFATTDMERKPVDVT